VMLVWHTHVHHGGSLAALAAEIGRDGLFDVLAKVWGPVLFGTPAAWLIIGVFAATQLALMRWVPGARFEGPVSPSGHVPVYKANGVACFVLTLAFFGLGSGPLGLFPASIVYDHLGEILGALNVTSLGLCLLLYLKGRLAPSGPDHGLSGNPVFDYYWGTELYPRVLGWDVKQFTNCRFGMMSWPLILISCAAAQHDRHGAVSSTMLVAVGIQMVYLAKFYWWETGYLRSLDIMHDRAGFYICWGCLVWVPSVYTASTLFLVDHPATWGAPAAAAAFLAGAALVMTNYFADAQRQRVRATAGNTTVWGKPPVLVRARYVTERGEAKENVLLASGFWGIARHFHYVPEWLGAVAWTLPAGFGHALPWFYVVFLAILLSHRALRDDDRCARKYGADWDEYKRRVPWKIVPGVV